MARYMSRRQAAELLGVTEATIIRWEKAGRLTPVRLGPRCVRYTVADVEALAR